MLLRVVRLVVVGAAVLLALHLFMLAGHGQAGHGSLEPPPGPATHDTLATLVMDQQAPPSLNHDAALLVGVDMAATCFAVLAALLLVGAGARVSLERSYTSTDTPRRLPPPITRGDFSS